MIPHSGRGKSGPHRQGCQITGGGDSRAQGQAAMKCTSFAQAARRYGVEGQCEETLPSVCNQQARGYVNLHLEARLKQEAHMAARQPPGWKLFEAAQNGR